MTNNSYKVGKLLYLNMEIFTNATIVPNYTYNNVFNIPTIYRPKNLTAVNAVAVDIDYGSSVACCSFVDTNGKININIPKSGNPYIFINAEWVCSS